MTASAFLQPAYDGVGSRCVKSFRRLSLDLFGRYVYNLGKMLMQEGLRDAILFYAFSQYDYDTVIQLILGQVYGQRLVFLTLCSFSSVHGPEIDHTAAYLICIHCNSHHQRRFGHIEVNVSAQWVNGSVVARRPAECDRAGSGIRGGE